ncbi:transposase [Mesorhizobium carmichaelinearum]|uniref:transposase n=1 Tax=Mesorhizobium carmichaelinearum TaxID=1208188 RepID=UPI000BA4089A
MAAHDGVEFTRLCGLARPHAQTALHRRQTQKVGRISKMGNRYIRRLLYLGAMAQIMLRCRLKREPGPDWLSSMLMRKKTKVVAIALAHRMARTIFAVIRDGSRYKPQATAARQALRMVRAK